MLRILLASISLCVSFGSQAFYDQHFPIPKETAYTPEDIFLLSKNTIDLRLRYEHALDKAYQLGLYPLKAGDGLTLGTKLNFQTARYYDAFVDLEFNNVTALLPHHFNSGNNTTPSKIMYAEIPDPKGTAFTQGYVGYLGIPETLIILGRQVIRLDNQRFVGDDHFRQTSQTFDAVTIVNHSLNNVELMYSYVGQVNSIWQGNASADFAKRQNNDHFINVSSKLAPFGTVVGYVYLIDDEAVTTNSSSTFGLRYLDDFNFNDINLYFVGEYARQHDYRNQPIPFSAFYTHFLAGIKGYDVDFSIGQELLSGNKAIGKSFRTPLASKHEFNGAADQFVETPDLGLSDWYGKLLVCYWDITLTTEYHHFTSQRGNASYGHEWDVAISRPFFKYYYLEVSVADFSGRYDFNYPDVRKYWLIGGVKFP